MRMFPQMYSVKQNIFGGVNVLILDGFAMWKEWKGQSPTRGRLILQFVGSGAPMALAGPVTDSVFVLWTLSFSYPAFWHSLVNSGPCTIKLQPTTKRGSHDTKDAVWCRICEKSDKGEKMWKCWKDHIQDCLKDNVLSMKFKRVCVKYVMDTGVFRQT